MSNFNKEEMMEYYRTKWYRKDDTIDVDIVNSIKNDIVDFKKDPAMYWLNELICTMDIENLFEMR
jgi:hypothetical protein